LHHKETACWVFQSLINQSDGPEEIQSILDFNVSLLPRLFQLLDDEKRSLVSAALGTITEIAESGNQHQKKMILDAGAIPILAKLLNHTHIRVDGDATRLACILTSTIFKIRATAQMDSLFSHKIVEALLNVLANNDDVDGQTDAAKAITTIARGKPNLKLSTSSIWESN